MDKYFSTFGSASSNKSGTLDKRVLFAALQLIVIAVYFWTSSRYPALDEKAALGGENDISALAFDQIVNVSTSDTIWSQIIGNALNWAYTNKQGMIFGVLFATAIMTLLKLLNHRQLKGRFSNTLLGVSIGAPLGVCVNCAVPIAMGANRSGARTETTLAILMSSPSLNMVVLGMIFSIFPFWLAGLKIGLTLAFIMFAIPLAVSLWGSKATPEAGELNRIIENVKSIPGKDEQLGFDYSARNLGWMDAFIWVVKETIKNFWYIFKLTVPLMILAGLLGAVVITIIPWELLANLLPSHGAEWFLALVLVSILGTFLPVPIAFDVVICAVLLTVGVPAAYVAALFITLGLYSIYPALQIWYTISKKLAVGLFFMVASLGLITGLLANNFANWEAKRQQTAIDQGLSVAVTDADVKLDRAPEDIGKTIVDKLSPEKNIPTARSSTIVTPWPFRSTQPIDLKSDKLFTVRYGSELGINEPDNMTPLRFLVPFDVNRSVASGDVHGDGWPDLIFSSNGEISLYKNISGKHFEYQNIKTPTITDIYIMRVALLDFDGDEDLDIVLGTHGEGVFLLENHKGRFTKNAQRIYKGTKATTTKSFAFGDIDRDGDLDIIVGNGAIGNHLVDRSHPAARNALLLKEGENWIETPILGPDGETLTILLSDLNADEWPDIFIGNDYAPPDQLWLSDSEGGFSASEPGFIKDATSKWTMSLASADIDGDLIPEIYSGNISGRQEAQPKKPVKDCQYEKGAEKEKCIQYTRLTNLFNKARRANDAVGCQSISDPYLAQGCTVVALTSILSNGGTGPEAIGDLCEKIPAEWGEFQALCHTRRSKKLTPLSDEELNETLKSDTVTNLLFKQNNSGGVFHDAAEKWQIVDGGWTWNARFADLNQDENQDLYVVNGHSLARKRYAHKLFMNKKGRFEDEAELAGIASSVPAAAYTYVDLDRDGDLDIVTVPLVGEIKVYKNQIANMEENHSVQFTLRGAANNTHAIGAKVIIRYGPNGSLAQMREIQMSGGHASFDEAVVHFGLGRHEKLNAVEIIWPDGKKTMLDTSLAANYRYEIRRQ